MCSRMDGRGTRRGWGSDPVTRIEETLEYRCYLAVAKVCGTLSSDHLGSDGAYDDGPYFESHLVQFHGTDIDQVFSSQHVTGVFGDQKWAFGDDLHASLFKDLDYDRYYLVNRQSETLDDDINSLLTLSGASVPDQFKQAAQLMERVRPEYRDKVVLTGLSLGGALSAYASIKAPWDVRTIVFDPLGLNGKMMGKGSWGFFGQGEVLSDRFRSKEEFVDWYYIRHSWVARLNMERHLSSVGRVTEVPQDPVRARNNKDTHDYRHVRFGLHKFWDEGWRGTSVSAA
jgi:hypothetical protein